MKIINRVVYLSLGMARPYKVIGHGAETEKRRAFLKGVATVGLGAMLAGCGGGGDKTDDVGGGDGGNGNGGSGSSDGGTDGGEEFEVEVVFGVMPAQTDPHTHSDAEITDTLSAIYEYPFWMDQTQKPAQMVPKLATEWGYADEKVYRTKIREDVKWHNGDTLTPEDVKWSMERISDPDVDVVSDLQGDWTNLTEINVDESDNSVLWHLEDRDPLFDIKIGARSDIMNKKWVQERSQEEISREANGTGPYKLEEFNQGIEIVVSKFDDWWQKSTDIDVQGAIDPLPDRIIFRGADEASARANQVIAGEADIAKNINPEDYGRIDSSDAGRMKFFDIDRTHYVMMNETKEPFGSKKVRKAFNYAVDNVGIVEAILNGRGTPVGQVAPPVWPGYNEEIEPYPHEPDKAQELYDSSGAGEHTFELHSRFGNVPKAREIALAIADQLTQSISQVTVEVNQVDAGTFNEKRKADGTFEGRARMWTGTTGGSPPHAGRGKLDSYVYSEGHSSGTNNEEFDAMFEAIETAESYQETVEMAKETQSWVHDHCPWIFCWSMQGSVGMSNRIDLEIPAQEDLHPYRIKQYQG